MSYPTNPDDANLRVITTLKRVFPDLHIGFSDHVAPDDTMMTLATAYLLGAEVIEKHFTLDKSLPGNDHYHAGDPDDFKKAIQNFQWINRVLGSTEKKAKRPGTGISPAFTDIVIGRQVVKDLSEDTILQWDMI